MSDTHTKQYNTAELNGSSLVQEQRDIVPIAIERLKRYTMDSKESMAVLFECIRKLTNGT